MDMEKLLEIGGAVEIKRDKETEMFLKSIEELAEAASNGKIKFNDKDIKIYKYENKEGFSVFFGSQGESGYEVEEVSEDRGRITYRAGYDWVAMQKGSPENLVAFLSAAGNQIIVDGKPYKITKPEEFAKAWYEWIKNQPTGFETKEEPSLEKYLSRRCGPRRPPTIRAKRTPYELIDMKEEGKPYEALEKEKGSEGPKIYRTDKF